MRAIQAAELAALWPEIAERRAANMRLFIAGLAAVAPPRLAPRRYQDFLTDTWQRLLLAD